MTQVRNSQQRDLVYSLMENNYSHPTAEEIFELAQKKKYKISRATVYRNLNLLSKLGKIRKIVIPGASEHYDCITENHYHFICQKCGKVYNIPIKYDESLNKTPKGMEDFKVVSHRLILEGICPKCKK